MKGIKLTITVLNESGESVVYQKRYDSVEQFFADHVAQYDALYGVGNWSVTLEF